MVGEKIIFLQMQNTIFTIFTFLRNDMEIKLWKLGEYIKRKFYCFEDFTELPVNFRIIS